MKLDRLLSLSPSSVCVHPCLLYLWRSEHTPWSPSSSSTFTCIRGMRFGSPSFPGKWLYMLSHLIGLSFPLSQAFHKWTVLPEAQACSLKPFHHCCEVGPALHRDSVKLSPNISEWEQCLLQSEAATEFPRASLRLASYHGECKTLSKVSDSQFICVMDAIHNDLK